MVPCVLSLAVFLTEILLFLLKTDGRRREGADTSRENWEDVCLRSENG